MGTKNTVYIISGGTNYYLSGGATTQTSYNGSGSPWTSESTTPYELSLNDATPIWTPQAAPAQPIYSGGPPFRDGRSLVYRSMDTVTEQVGIQIKATSKDNAIALLRQLRQILNTALSSLPAVLAVTGGTNTGYAEIFSADVQETASYLAESDGMMRAVITWTRTPTFGPSSLTTLINGATFTNTGTGANNNTQSLGSLTGDYVNDGQPINITLTKPSGTSAPGQFFFATVASRVYTSVNTAQTTSATGLGTSISTITPSITSALTNDAIKARFVGRVKTLTNPTKAQLAVVVSTSGLGVIWRSKWVSLLTNTTGQYIDFGSMDLSFFQVPIATSITLSAEIDIRSTDGTSVTATLDYMEFLLYYDFCYALFSTSMASGEAVYLNQAQNRSGGGWLPMFPARTYYGTAISPFDPTIPGVVIGTPPRPRPSTSLYVAWRGQNDGAHVTSETSTVTVSHAPQYATLRGGG